MIAAEPHPVLRSSPYQGYVYAYPHKTAYRALHPRPLRAVWAQEDQRQLFLYVHIPFCAMRCGFCNLFTTAKPHRELVTWYLEALDQQAHAVREAIPDARFARFAIGGGTPTYLSDQQLAHLLDQMQTVMGIDPHTVPTSVECSPDTLTEDKVELLKSRGVDRVSIGIQSFVETETVNCGRPQSPAVVTAALSLLAEAQFPVWNIDLIYGLPGQTVDSWLYSLRQALSYRPEELYLYPLYVRPLTGLGRSRKEWDDVRLACYRVARDHLLGNGYEQVSMRMFRRRRGDSPENDHSSNFAKTSGKPHYCCQTDGMVGLGCGARSYTRALHYSFDYAVAPRSIKRIIADYLARSRAEFAQVEHGFLLNGDEQKRRYLLQSILNTDGLDIARYEERFGSNPADDFPDLATFADFGLLTCDGSHWRPTALGLERSDALGPWFISPQVQHLMAEYQAQ
jgi:oxygen-independent coproporphyrinogen-3 oxidase